MRAADLAGPKALAALPVWALFFYGNAVLGQNVPQMTTSISDFATEADFADLPTNDRGRNQSVAQRHWPAYDALGVDFPAGLQLLPRLTAGGGYTDNLYRTGTSATSAQFLAVAPAVNLISTWSQDAVWAGASADLRRYPDYSSENENRWRINAGGRLDLTPESFLEGGASFMDNYEDRGGSASPLLATGPVGYSLPQAYLRAVSVQARSRFSLSGQLAKFDYHDVGSADGGVLDQHYRDERILRLQAKAEYGLFPEAAGFGEVTFTKSDFTDGEPIVQGRDSNDVRFLAGANFDLTELVRGELAAGYVRRHFDSPVLQRVEGLAVLASIEYFATPLTTITLRLRRAIEDSTLALPTSLFANSAELRLDHELLRNLTLGAQFTYRLEQFQNSPREDRVRLAAANARYLLSSAWSFELGVSRLERTTTEPLLAPHYRSTDLFLNVTLQH